jgi:sugar (pentulose or hexulose) kinase
VIVTPGIVPGCGPYPGATHRVVNAPGGLEPDEAHVAASLYAALMTRACLDLAGAAGPIVVEGPFARNDLFWEALSRATGRPVLPVGGSTGTSLGAAMLVQPRRARGAPPAAAAADGGLLPAGFERYCAEWSACAA